MRFSDWYNLKEIAVHLPSKPGLFQIRIVNGLLNYPSGKSAMFYYGFADNLKRDVPPFLQNRLPILEQSGDALLIRSMPAQDARSRFQKYLDKFLLQFGSLPQGNEILMQDSI